MVEKVEVEVDVTQDSMEFDVVQDLVEGALENWEVERDCRFSSDGKKPMTLGTWRRGNQCGNRCTGGGTLAAKLRASPWNK